MSINASEIITSLATMLRQHLVDLHNQTVNDVQGIVGSAETRILEQLMALNQRIDAVEAQAQRRRRRTAKAADAGAPEPEQ